MLINIVYFYAYLHITHTSSTTVLLFFFVFPFCSFISLCTLLLIYQPVHLDIIAVAAGPLHQPFRWDLEVVGLLGDSLFETAELISFVGRHAGGSHLRLGGGATTVGLLAGSVPNGLVGGGEVFVLGCVRLSVLVV